MNNRIFPDYSDENESCGCESCSLAEAYYHAIVNVPTYRELKELLHDVVEESIEIGYRTALEEDVEVKNSILNDYFLE